MRHYAQTPYPFERNVITTWHPIASANLSIVVSVAIASRFLFSVAARAARPVSIDELISCWLARMLTRFK
jgi:hypothetical protein